MSGAARIDMRRHLRCQPSLPDFRQLHPELRLLLDAAMREEAPALCDAVARVANITRITREGAAFGKGPMQAIATDKYAVPIIHWGLQVAELIRT